MEDGLMVGAFDGDDEARSKYKRKTLRRIRYLDMPGELRLVLSTIVQRLDDVWLMAETEELSGSMRDMQISGLLNADDAHDARIKSLEARIAVLENRLAMDDGK
jgi:hypothetical protein